MIRAEIARQRRDQKEIATALGLHSNVFGRKVRGEVAFAAGELLEVACALGLSAGEIIQEAEERFTGRAVEENSSALAAASSSTASEVA